MATKKKTKQPRVERSKLDDVQRNSLRRIDDAVELGIREYAKTRRALVDEFIDRNFDFDGAWKLNRLGFGWDLLRAPANLAWAPVRYFAKGAASLAGKAGFDRIEKLGQGIPAGFQTDVERELEWLIFSELLELPYRDEVRQRSHEANALIDCIARQDSMREAWEEVLRAAGDLSKDGRKRRDLEKHLEGLLDNRKDVAELTTAIVATSAGLAAHKSLNFGALGLGQATAAAISHSLAVSGFIFGPTLGGIFYGALPWLAAPSAALVVGVTAGIAALMGVLAAVAGVLADPAQRALGLHKKKLNGMLDVVEANMLGEKPGAQAFREGLAARLFDLVDVVYTVGKKLA